MAWPGSFTLTHGPGGPSSHSPAAVLSPDARLLPSQVAALRRVYDLFACADAESGASSFPASSLLAFLRALDGGGVGAGLAAATSAALFARYDSAGRGTLSFEAFSVLVASEPLPGLGGAPLVGALEVELARHFAAADVDGDGCLDAADVSRVVHDAGVRSGGGGGSTAAFTASDAKRVIVEAAGVDAERISLPQWLDLVKMQALS